MKNVIGIIIDFLLIIIFSSMVFVYADTQAASFWTSYLFVVLAFLIQLISYYTSIKNKEIVHRIALVLIAGFYLIGQIIISVLGFTLWKDKESILLSFCIFLLLGYSIVVLTYMNIIKRQGHLHADTLSYQNLLMKLEMCEKRTESPELREEIKKLVESLKYSDAVGCSETEEIEKTIEKEIEDLDISIKDNRTADCKRKCLKVSELIEERKVICKHSK